MVSLGPPQDYGGGFHFFSLLIIVLMEVLIRILSKAVGGGHITGFTFGNEANDYMESHLLFADDVLIFLWYGPKSNPFSEVCSSFL